MYPFVDSWEMDCIQAQALAESLMRQWRLDQWKLELPYRGWVGRLRYCAGCCSHRDRTISLQFVMESVEAEVRDTILHEIAHALVGPRKHHGPDWRRIPRKVGARPRARQIPLWRRDDLRRSSVQLSFGFMYDEVREYQLERPREYRAML